jgi:hypothetical protein
VNFTEPLGLPRGTVRALLTIVLVVAVAAVTATGHDSTSLAVLAGIAVRDYFAARGIQNESDGPALEPPSLND